MKCKLLVKSGLYSIPRRKGFQTLYRPVSPYMYGLVKRDIHITVIGYHISNIDSPHLEYGMPRLPQIMLSNSAVKLKIMTHITFSINF